MSLGDLTAEQARERRSELLSYYCGMGLALLLTLIPFALVAYSDLARMTIWWIIGGCALLQIVVHFRFFLHITLAKSKREDLQLILFSVLILMLMVGGTLWILFNLYYRMAPSMAS